MFKRDPDLDYSKLCRIMPGTHVRTLDVRKSKTTDDSIIDFVSSVDSTQRKHEKVNIRMGNVKLRIDGRSSKFDLWSFHGNHRLYAVDVYDDSFICVTK